MGDAIHGQVLVLGGGPGGTAAAFRAADLGLDVVLVERYPRLGGVCLNVGCIPSKTLLHVADVMAQAEALAEMGVDFAAPAVDLARLRAGVEGVVRRLTTGLQTLADRRRVRVIRGRGRFVGAHELEVIPPAADEGGPVTVRFEHAIVAVGSRAVTPSFGQGDDPRVTGSTGALALPEVPGRLLVVGGGIIGLELATVYDALGSQVTVVELTADLVPGCDRDLVRPLLRRLRDRYEAIHTDTTLVRLEPTDAGLVAHLKGPEAPSTATFDRALVAVGRRPNGDRIDAAAAGFHVDERGFIPTDERGRTNASHIYAVGDVAGEPMLAHKAAHEAVVAAEDIAGEPAGWLGRAIPFVAYTDPEIAWVGLTLDEARRRGQEVETAAFPWAANGRSLSRGRGDGMTRLVLDPESGRVLGGGIVGQGAGELIAEVALAVEMGADAEDLALTIHPHPTASETVGMAAEVARGTVTDLLPPRQRSPRG